MGKSGGNFLPKYGKAGCGWIGGAFKIQQVNFMKKLC